MYRFTRAMGEFPEQEVYECNTSLDCQGIDGTGCCGTAAGSFCMSQFDCDVLHEFCRESPDAYQYDVCGQGPMPTGGGGGGDVVVVGPGTTGGGGTTTTGGGGSSGGGGMTTGGGSSGGGGGTTTTPGPAGQNKILGMPPMVAAAVGAAVLVSLAVVIAK